MPKSRQGQFSLLTILLFVAVTLGGVMIVFYVQGEERKHDEADAAARQAALVQSATRNFRIGIQSLQGQLEIAATHPDITSGDAKTCQTRLESLGKQLAGRVGNIGRLGSDGIFKCSLNKALIGRKGSDLGSYVTTIFNDPTHQPVISNALKVPGAKSLVAALHVPVQLEGKFNGTLGGGVYLDSLTSSYLDSVKLEKDAFIIVFDKTGTIVEHPEKSLINTKLDGKEYQKFVGQDYDALAATVKQAQVGQTGTIVYTSGGLKRMTTFASAEIFPGHSWVIGVGDPFADVVARSSDQDARRLMATALLAFAALAGLAAIIGVSFVARAVIKPIKQISVVASQFGQGNFAPRLPYQGEDEIGVLSSTLNGMAGRLAGYYTELQQEVADKTAALSAEKSNAEQEQARDEALLQSIGEGLIVIDADGKITKINPAAIKLLGYSESELLGKWYPSAITELDESGKEIDAQDRSIIKSLSTAKSSDFSIQYLHKNGIPFYTHLTVSPFLLGNKPAGAIVVFRDISDEKKLAKLKDEFLSIASHELRTPMGAIRALVTMILAGDYGSIAKGLVDPLNDVRLSTLRLVSLVNDLLSAARLEAGRMKFEIKQFDLAELADRLASTMAPLAKEKKIKLEFQKSDPITVQGDPAKVEQILTNMLGNSLKFTDQGSITISLQPKDGLVDIDVADTGQGVSPAGQQQLFGKFSQISTAQKGRPPGTGLGLYISREMARKMGGELWIKHSEVGKGSTFAMSIPLPGSKFAKIAEETIARESEVHNDQK